MTKVNTAIICAAGKGSRLGHSFPKACVEVGGKSIIQWQLEALKNMRNVAVVLGYRRDFVIDEILMHRNNITVVVNKEWETTNTAYSLSLACELFNETVLTVDGDTLFTSDDVNKMLRHHMAIGVTMPMSDEGVFVDVNANHNVTGFTRNRNTGLEWTGMSVMPSNIYQGKPNCYVYQIIEKYLPVYAQQIDLVEVDTPNDLVRAREWALKRGQQTS